MPVLQTTYLGLVRGRSDGRVDEYLGIPYATLSNRLAEAVLVSRSQGAVLDAGKDGPTTISPLQGCDLEFSIMQHSLPKGALPQSDTECLNLNIAVPASVDRSCKLPVLVFIHGGGFNIGANSWPQFNMARFVNLSAELGLPIVAITINYRLGPFGFLTSEELRGAGYKANNGLRDQRVALEWIQRHIVDFGGDPGKVTLSGMSAGGASVMYQLSYARALFQRAIAMSGNYFLLPPLALAQHEENYSRAIAALGLASATTEERIHALIETPGHEIISRLPQSVIAAPAVDGELITDFPTFAELADPTGDVPLGKKWCKALMIGDAQMDANIVRVLMPGASKGCAQRFISILKSTLCSRPEIAQDILDRYGISVHISDDQAFAAILDYINDIAFFAPTLAAAQGWRGNAHVYYFNQGNPWEGPSKGRAGHLLDVIYLFQNFREFLTPEQQALGIRFAGDFLKFCHADSPWPAVDGPNLEDGFVAQVYGSRESSGTRVNKAYSPFNGKSDRRSILFDYAGDVSLDELIDVFYQFRGF